MSLKKQYHLTSRKKSDGRGGADGQLDLLVRYAESGEYQHRNEVAFVRVQEWLLSITTEIELSSEIKTFTLSSSVDVLDHGELMKVHKR